MNKIREYIGMVDRTVTTVQQARAQLMNQSWLFILIMGLLGIASSLFRAVDSGWQTVMLVQIVLYCVVLLVVVFRKRIVFYVQTAVLIGSALLLGIVGLFSFGLAGTAVLTLGVACLLTAVLLGTRPAIIILLINLTIITVVGISVVTGAISYTFDANDYITSAAAWIFAFIELIAIAGLSIIGIGVTQIHLQKTLQQSETQFQQLIETVPFGIVIQRGNQIIYANPQIVKIVGADSAEAIIGRSMSSFVRSDYQPATHERINVLNGNGQGESLIYGQIMQLNGRLADITIYSVPITYQGQPASYSIINDVTEKLKMEETLRESNWQLQKAQKVASLGSWEWDVLADKATWSDQMYRIYGLDPSEKNVNWAFNKLTHPDDKAIFDKVMAKALAGQASPTIEYRIIRPDGELRFVQVRSEMFYDESGDFLQIVGTVQDITKRKQAERVLQKSKNNLAKAQAIAHVGSWEWDVQTNELHWSDEMRRIYGFDLSFKPTNEAVYELIHSDDKVIFERAMANLSPGEAPPYIEYRIVRSDNRLRFVHVRAETVYDESGVLLKMMGTVQDITERKEAEQELRQYTNRLETLNEITAVLSASLSLNEVLTRILQKLALVVAYDGVSIFLQEGDQFRAVIYQGPLPAEKITNQLFPKSNELFPEQFYQQTPIYLEDAQADSRFDTWVGTYYVRGWMGVPLLIRDEMIGYLNLDSYQVGAYGADEAAIVMPFANQAAQAIENARLHEQVQQHVDELDQRVRERTADLNQLVQLMAGREVRMAELKKVIRKLRKQLQNAEMEPVANDPLLDS